MMKVRVIMVAESDMQNPLQKKLRLSQKAG
jgi:hypothetical protein